MNFDSDSCSRIRSFRFRSVLPMYIILDVRLSTYRYIKYVFFIGFFPLLVQQAAEKQALSRKRNLELLDCGFCDSKQQYCSDPEKCDKLHVVVPPYGGEYAERRYGNEQVADV